MSFTRHCRATSVLWLSAAILAGAGPCRTDPRGTGGCATTRAGCAPAGEPGERLSVAGVVVDASGKPVGGASLYIYQADREGYYGTGK